MISIASFIFSDSEEEKFARKTFTSNDMARAGTYPSLSSIGSAATGNKVLSIPACSVSSVLLQAPRVIIKKSMMIVLISTFLVGYKIHHGFSLNFFNTKKNCG